MKFPVVCMECGLPLSDKATMFVSMRERAIKKALEKNNVSSSNLIISSDVNVDCGNILDVLKIRRYCCRMTIMTAVSLEKYRK